MRDLVQPVLRRQLRRLGRRLRAHLAGEGLAAVLAALAALVAVTAVADYGSHRLTHDSLTAAERLIVLAACLAAVGTVAWRRLVRPLATPMLEEDLALAVERRRPALGDRLITAVQFSRLPDAAAVGASESLVRRAAEEAVAAARPLDFTALVRSGRMLRWGAAAAGAWLALGAVAAARPDLAAVWFQRHVLLASAEWPRRTYLAVRGAPVLLAVRGGPLDLVVEADPAHVVPAQVTLGLDLASVGTVEETVPLASAGGHTYVKSFEAVTEPLRFRAWGGDDRTAVCEVRLVDPPQAREVALAVEPPPHTRRPAQVLPGSEGVLTVPEGSWITLTATATKDLAGAEVHAGGEAAACEVLAPASPGAGPRRVRARFQALRPPGQAALAVRLALEDAEGVANPRAARYTVVPTPDREPAVQATARGIGTQITPRAAVPLDIIARDDYGVRAVVLDWEIPGLSARPLRQAVRDPAGDAPDVRAAHVLDLERLSAGLGPGESLVQPGETLRLTVGARDACPEPEGPNWGRAAPIVLRLVSEEDLLASLLQMQKALREQCRQALVLQGEAQARAEAARREAARGGAAAEVARLAGESASNQQQVAARVGAVADRLAQVLAELTSNRAGAEPDRRRLQEKVVAPLQDLAGEPMSRAAADLRAILVTADAAAAADALGRAADAQADLYRRLEAVLAEMAQLQTAQELERWLKMIIDTSRRVKQRTEAERRAEQERVLERLRGTPP